MDTEVKGSGLSQSVAVCFSFKFNGANLPSIEYFGGNHKFLECMAYNIGGVYVS